MVTGARGLCESPLNKNQAQNERGCARRLPQGWLALIVLSLLAIWPAFVSAEQLIFKRARFIENEQSVNVSVGFREMFDHKLRQRLKSGFTTTVVMRIYLYNVRVKNPIAHRARTFKAVYDLWKERYQLTIEDHRGVSHLVIKEQRKVIDKLTSLWRFPIASLRQIRPKQLYFVAVVAEVNPMSQELLTEVQRWLRTPHGGHRQVSDESFFGSFVSIFINDKIRRAEKTFRIKTQRFFRQ